MCSIGFKFVKSWSIGFFSWYVCFWVLCEVFCVFDVLILLCWKVGVNFFVSGWVLWGVGCVSRLWLVYVVCLYFYGGCIIVEVWCVVVCRRDNWGFFFIVILFICCWVGWVGFCCVWGLGLCVVFVFFGVCFLYWFCCCCGMFVCNFVLFGFCMCVE